MRSRMGGAKLFTKGQTMPKKKPAAKPKQALKETEEQLNNLAIQQKRLIGALATIQEAEEAAAGLEQKEEQSED